MRRLSDTEYAVAIEIDEPQAAVHATVNSR